VIMTALAEVRPTLLPALRLTGKAIAGFAAISFTAITIGLAALLFPSHDPNDCRYGEPPHVDHPETQIPPPVIARPVSPDHVDFINRCPGGFQYSTGDFKFH
jgi:hypothetical protein